jgi:hypothetical protein
MLPVILAQVVGLLSDELEITGALLTVTVAIVELVHAVAVLVPVIVYVVVAKGFAVTVAPVDVLSPVAGDHEYVLAPEAVSVAELPAQMVALFTEILGLGFTVIVNEIEFPTQLFSDGLTVMVEVIGAPVLFVNVNEGIFPVPDPASPIAVLLFVQV